MKQAMAACKYNGPPQLFTMFLCLVGSKNMNYDIAWLEKHAACIKKTHASMEAEAGMSPIPAAVCLEVLRCTRSS